MSKTSNTNPPAADEPAGKSPAKSSETPGEKRPGPAGWRRRLPRPETLLMMAAAVATIGGKVAALRSQKSGDLFATSLRVIREDVNFFVVASVLLILLNLAGARRPRLAPWTARLTMFLAASIFIWSLADAAWLMREKVQLLAGVVALLVTDLRGFGPILKAQLDRNPVIAVPVLLIGGLSVCWMLWRFIRPRPSDGQARGSLVMLVLLAIAAAAVPITATMTRGRLSSFSGEVLTFNSHWHAIRDVFFTRSGGPDAFTRDVVLSGERNLAPPADAVDPPDIVILFLESVSWRATGFSDDGVPTPNIRAIGERGVRFDRTYVPVSQTNKAFWAALTGTTPEISPDYSESIILDTPLESLATILGRHGYRSAFMQAAMGSFAAMPSLFANFGFDYASFREDYHDPSLNIGYLSGDDARTVSSMIEWLEAGGDDPSLLVSITSVSHDPYETPDWWTVDTPPTTEEERYRETIRFTDAWVGQIVNALEAAGRLDNTILVVMGDHGDGFRVDSGRGRWKPYEEVIRVPWVMQWPDGMAAQPPVEHSVSQTDLTPTLFSLMDWTGDLDQFDGLNAMDTSPEAVRAAADRRFYFSSWYRGSPLGYVEGDQKFVWWPEPKRVFAYDLATDPDENEVNLLSGEERSAVIDAVELWRNESRLDIAPRRFRKSVLYDDWRVFSTGRVSRAVYIGEAPREVADSAPPTIGMSPSRDISEPENDS